MSLSSLLILSKVNGTHLSADSNSFLEKRRRGLVRFVQAVVRHPVLSQEQLVVMFLTVPTVSVTWRDCRRRRRRRRRKGQPFLTPMLLL